MSSLSSHTRVTEAIIIGGYQDREIIVQRFIPFPPSLPLLSSTFSAFIFSLLAKGKGKIQDHVLRGRSIIDLCKNRFFHYVYIY